MQGCDTICMMIMSVYKCHSGVLIILHIAPTAERDNKHIHSQSVNTHTLLNTMYVQRLLLEKDKQVFSH